MIIFLSFIIFFLGVLSIGLIVFLLRSRNNTFDPTNVMVSLKENIERIERSVKQEIAQSRDENRMVLRETREEVNKAIKLFEDSILSRMTQISSLQKNQLDTFSQQISSLTTVNEQKLDKVRETVEKKLQAIQEDNSKKLEQMRATVDEKLHTTLERRLGDSFKLVSERLELVQKGLGEMQNLAVGVGDLKKVLTNVKARGTWGEIQLGALLEQIFNQEQFERNVEIKKGSNERVDYAIKLPGRDNTVVWLPLDAKFPKEDYEKLIEAQEKADTRLVEEFGKQLENRIKLEAKSIKDKYIEPPHTVDFAILFLPTEGLFAEVLRRPGLCDFLQREYRIAITGPTTIAAFLNTLQMGFRTLAIEKRSSEVWQLLAAVKQEFHKFGDILDKTHKKIKEASDTIEDASRKSRTIQKRLRNVQDMPVQESLDLVEDTFLGNEATQE